MTITVCIGLVTVVQNGVTYTIPTVTMAPDDYWVWRKISDVVNDLNAITGVTACLLGPDGPALQIAKQSNQFTVPSEAITMTDQMLANANVIESSLTFSVAPGSYVFNPQTGELIFSGTLPSRFVRGLPVHRHALQHRVQRTGPVWLGRTFAGDCGR